MELDLSALRALAASQNLPLDDVTDVVTAALTDAYARTHAADPEAVVTVDTDTGKFVLRHPNNTTSAVPSGLGRIAAATARQAIVQWLRDQQRRHAVGPWADLEGTAQEAVVVRHVPARGKHPAETQLRIGTTDAVLPDGEAIPGETQPIGERVHVLLLAANVDDRDRIRLTVSRRQPALVTALFTFHVPELARGDIAITAVARDPGCRTKVAVNLTSAALDGLDPRVALVGPNATRIRAVTTALSGERVDVVLHGDNLADFVAAALTPGTVEAATVVDEHRRQVVADVRPDQVALVTGRGGANVRLAQRLTGARIEVRQAS